MCIPICRARDRVKLMQVTWRSAVGAASKRFADWDVTGCVLLSAPRISCGRRVVLTRSMYLYIYMYVCKHFLKNRLLYIYVE